MSAPLFIEIDTSKLVGLASSRPIITKHLKNAMRYSRATLQRRMKYRMNFAHPTGNLESSIHAEPAGTIDPYFNAVGTNVTYARFVNYGTGRRGEQSSVPHPPDYQYGPKPGMRAQPFAEPSFLAAQPAVQLAFAKEMELALAEIAGTKL